MPIYVCSDLHFNHTNILGFCRSNFTTIEEHNEYIIKQYNSVVGKDDLVYILGDVGFTPEKALSELVKRLNGRKILLVGNHDKLTDREYRAISERVYTSCLIFGPQKCTKEKLSPNGTQILQAELTVLVAKLHPIWS